MPRTCVTETVDGTCERPATKAVLLICPDEHLRSVDTCAIHARWCAYLLARCAECGQRITGADVAPLVGA